MGCTLCFLIAVRKLSVVAEPLALIFQKSFIQAKFRLGCGFPGSRFPGARESRSFSVPEFPGMKRLYSRINHREQQTAVAASTVHVQYMHCGFGFDGSVLAAAKTMTRRPPPLSSWSLLVLAAS